MEMSIRLDLEYTAELNDATSSEYKDLESKVHTVVSALLMSNPVLTYIFSSSCCHVISHMFPQLQQQYKGITGFINVFVKAFR